MVPILGPRTQAQLSTNLAALNLKLAAEHFQRLQGASAIDLGVPHEVNKSTLAQMNARIPECVDLPATSLIR